MVVVAVVTLAVVIMEVVVAVVVVVGVVTMCNSFVNLINTFTDYSFRVSGDCEWYW